jgi:hypothetical protein
MANFTTYENLNEQQLLTQWHIEWDKHEESYVGKNTKGCVEASIALEKIDKVLMDKYQYTGEDLNNMMNMISQ